ITDEIGAIQFRFASQGANMQGAIRLLNILKAINTVDINQHRRPRETESNEGNEALASCQNLGILAVFIQQGNSFVDAVRHQIIERTRYQSVTSIHKSLNSQLPPLKRKKARPNGALCFEKSSILLIFTLPS